VSMISPMLQLTDVHTFYGDSYVLQGVSLSVQEGSVVALMGRNGTGKTTVINSVIGFAPPRHGEVRFEGVDITRAEPHRIARMGIGIVPQERRIFPSLSVRENLMIASRRRSGRKSCWDLDRVLESFPVLKERLNARGRFLSGGELQMLAIARALMTNPALLLMDEAFEGLSPAARLEVKRVIGKLKDEAGLSILLVSHDPFFTLEVADHVYVMSKGKVVYDSTPRELQDNGEVKASYLGL